MSCNSDIVAAARGWLGTPYVHQASVRGAGTDCLGLIRGIWRDVMGREPAPIPAYTPDWAEPARDELLWRAARTHLVEKPKHRMAPGDVILFRMRAGSVAKHLGIVETGGTQPRFIHAYARHGVVSSPLTPPWARRIVACFAFPERS